MKKEMSNTFAVKYLRWEFLIRLLPITITEHGTPYKVEAWPTIFLLDKQRRIRWKRVGKGDYDEAERLIQKLLTEKES